MDFHSLPFGINIGPSAFSYILGKVLVKCSEYTLNYPDYIMVFSETWEGHLMHLAEVFKWLKEADLKIKHSKCEFFKSKAPYLGYLVGANGIQPLPEKVTAIEALEPPQNIEKLQHSLGLVGFYRKFIPFFADITACLNTILRRGMVFEWTEQCNNAFNLLKSELVKMPIKKEGIFNTQIQTKHLSYLPMHQNIVIPVFCIKRRWPMKQIQYQN